MDQLQELQEQVELVATQVVLVYTIKSRLFSYGSDSFILFLFAQLKVLKAEMEVMVGMVRLQERLVELAD